MHKKNVVTKYGGLSVVGREANNGPKMNQDAFLIMPNTNDLEH